MKLKALLAKLVSINSIYPNENSLAQWIETYLLSTNWKVKRQYLSRKRFNLLASKGRGKSAAMFYGHLDTVNYGSGWKINPFNLVIKGDNAYGLGAYDMKGGLVVILKALEKTKQYVKLLLAVDEENISEGAWSVVDKHKAFFKDVRFIVSAEPNFNTGLHSLTIGRTGRCVFNIELVSPEKHIADRTKGIDAIELTGKYINLLYAKKSSLFKSADSDLQIRKIAGEANGMSTCGRVSLEVEVLLGQGDSTLSIQKSLTKLNSRIGLQLKPRKTPYLEGYYFSSFPEKAILKTIVKTYLNKSANFISRRSVGDDNVLATLHIPVITWGPDGGNAHAANEFVNLKSLKLLIKMYSDLINFML